MSLFNNHSNKKIELIVNMGDKKTIYYQDGSVDEEVRSSKRPSFRVPNDDDLVDSRSIDNTYFKMLTSDDLADKRNKEGSYFRMLTSDDLADKRNKEDSYFRMLTSDDLVDKRSAEDSYFRMPTGDDLADKRSAEDTYFRMLTSDDLADKRNEEDTKLSSSLKILNMLMLKSNSSRYRDDCIKDIEEWLRLRRENNILDNEYCEATYRLREKSKDSDCFSQIGTVTPLVDGVKLGKYDYRITICNNEDISYEDGSKFIEALKKKALELGVICGWKNYWEADAIILYCDLENLSSTVNLLEELKKDPEIYKITKKFNVRKMFGIGIDDDSYYFISMGTCDKTPNTKIKSTMGSNAGGWKTFGGYMEELLNESLLELYNEGVDITPLKLYNLLVEKHNRYGMLPGDDIIPLWQNHYNYRVMRDLEESIEKKRGSRK